MFGREARTLPQLGIGHYIEYPQAYDITRPGSVLLANVVWSPELGEEWVTPLEPQSVVESAPAGWCRDEAGGWIRISDQQARLLQLSEHINLIDSLPAQNLRSVRTHGDSLLRTGESVPRKDALQTTRLLAQLHRAYPDILRELGAYASERSRLPEASLRFVRRPLLTPNGRDISKQTRLVVRATVIGEDFLDPFLYAA